MVLRTTAIRAAVTGISLLLLASCNGDGDSPESPIAPSEIRGMSLSNLVSSLSVGLNQGVLAPGQAPVPRGGPTIAVSGNQQVINGGTLSVAIASGTPFQTIYMFAGSPSLGLNASAEGGIDGYYQLRLPSSETSTTALLSFAPTVALTEFELLFAVADPSGVVGPFARLSTNVRAVGTGDVQVTLSWDTEADVDLHVVDPRGEEIYYGHKQSASGGELDLDSNAGCTSDGIRNENIVWPVGRAPRGVYTVRVDYWSNCGVAQTNYTVRINNGGSVQVVTGTFTGPGDAGSAGSGRFISSFERLTGPTAAPTSSLSTTSSVPASTKQKTAAPRP